jgi:copper(I)-binding protein
VIHETRVDNGMSQMRPAENLALPARGQLVFAPNGRHMMLMHPTRTLKVGDRVWLELGLAGGGRIRASFEVRREAPATPKR